MTYSFDDCPSRKGSASVKYDLRQMFFNTDDVIPLWVADMDFRTPAFIMDAVRKRAEHEILGYSIRPQSFFDAIINWNQKRHQWKVENETILFSPGIVPALNMAVEAYTEKGDAVLVQPPVYFPFFNAVKDFERLLIENPLRLSNGRLNIDFEDFEQKIVDNNVKMFLLSNPHNPGGTVWTEEELQRMGEICLKHSVLVLSDEIHADLIFEGHKHTPLASVSEKIAANTITAMAPSKTFNIAGLATSYMIISNPDLRGKFEKTINRWHVGNGNIFGNVALEAAYNYGEEWLEELMAYLKGNITYVHNFIAEHLPRIKVVFPEATYLVWLDCRGLKLGDDQLRDFFIQEAGLGLNEGRSFGTGGSGFMRLNIAAPKSLIEKAMGQLKTAYDKRF